MSTIKIGRSKACDCVFSDPSVSKEHAMLYYDGSTQQYRLKDLNSTNGTAVNRRPLTEERVVTKEDRISFGGYDTTLTAILETAKRQAAQKKAAAQRNALQGRLMPGALLIGRDPGCTIRLAAPDVSKQHAQLYIDAQGNPAISDLGSTNGTFVNGQRVTQATLRPGDSVRVASQELAWQQYVRIPEPPQQPVQRRKRRSLAWLWITLAAVFAGCAAVAIWYFWPNKMNEKQIADNYTNSVAWVVNVYGFKVYVDGEDATATVYRAERLTGTQNEVLEKNFGAEVMSEYVHIEDGDLKAGPNMAQGTAFFISDDGKLATNLHIAKPWLAGDEEQANQIMDRVKRMNFLQGNFEVALTKIKVEPVCVGMVLVLNGDIFDETNFKKCKLLKGGDNLEKDVAVIQLLDKKTPDMVKKFVDLNEAETDPKATKQGEKIFTIGFPYGLQINLTDKEEVRNQIGSGICSNDYGEFLFGFNAPIAGGASGSPIFNERGHLVGVVSQATQGSNSFNRGVKVKHLLDLRN